MTFQAKMFQTAAGPQYDELLSISGVANRNYCAAQGIAHETWSGLKRGYFPWHATFNRIIYLKEQADVGYDGWIFYLDADAYVYGQQVGLRELLADCDGDMVFGPGGLTGERWDVNAGVFLINLGSAAGRALVECWHAHFMCTTEEALQGAQSWGDVHDDQERLHDILQQRPDLNDRLTILPREFFNDQKASFVRQVLRSNVGSMEERIATLKAGVIEAVGSGLAAGMVSGLDSQVSVASSSGVGFEGLDAALSRLGSLDALGLAHRYALQDKLSLATAMAELALSDREALGNSLVNALVLLSSLRERQGQMRKAADAILMALKISPDDEGVRHDCDRICGKVGL